MQEKTGEKGRRQIQAAKSWPWTRQTEKEIKNILLLTVTYDWAWALVPSQLGLMSSCFTCSCKQDQQTDPSFCLLGGCCFFLLVCLFVCFLCRARCLTWGRTSGKQFYPVIGFLLAYICMYEHPSGWGRENYADNLYSMLRMEILRMGSCLNWTSFLHAVLCTQGLEAELYRTLLEI